MYYSGFLISDTMFLRRQTAAIIEQINNCTAASYCAAHVIINCLTLTASWFCPETTTPEIQGMVLTTTTGGKMRTQSPPLRGKFCIDCKYFRSVPNILALPVMFHVGGVFNIFEAFFNAFYWNKCFESSVTIDSVLVFYLCPSNLLILQSFAPVFLEVSAPLSYM